MSVENVIPFVSLRDVTHTRWGFRVDTPHAEYDFEIQKGKIASRGGFPKQEVNHYDIPKGETEAAREAVVAWVKKAAELNSYFRSLLY